MIITNKQLREENRIIKSAIGKELARIRKDNNISTYDLQNQGYRSQQYKTVEQGDFNMTIDRLFKYCNAIGAEIKLEEGEGLCIRIQQSNVKDNEKNLDELF